VNKTVASVMDELNLYESRHGTIWYVNCMFTDDSVGSVGKKTEESALTVQRQLQDAIGEELDFHVEDGGTSKAGRQKWKIIEFRAPGAGTVSSGGDNPNEGPRPHLGSTPSRSTDQASIRASVAVKAAVELGGDINTVLENADAFNAWMLEKTSEPALSAYVDESGTVRQSASELPAGAGSETTSAPRMESPDEDSGGGESLSRVGADPRGVGGNITEGGSSDVENPSTPHEQHDWQPHPNLHGWLICDCGAARKKFGLEQSVSGTTT
jgi:hypothetical protein